MINFPDIFNLFYKCFKCLFAHDWSDWLKYSDYTETRFCKKCFLDEYRSIKRSIKK